MSLLPVHLLNSGSAFAEDAYEEARKEKLAKYVFIFSSPYDTEKFETTPHAHREIKEVIERVTNNKIYVKIHDKGIDGTGSSLTNSVKFNQSQGALLSVSNLVPRVPEFDILNIPFWSSGEAEYMRLFNSVLWDRHVMSKTQRFKLKILMPYVVGARTATSTKKYGKLIKTPEDFEGITFRIPGSKSLGVFYDLTKAIPVTVRWEACARTARKGRYDALDPSVAGLFSGPGDLRNELGIISEIESVYDGWVAIGNSEFIESLDPKTKTQFYDAFREIQEKQLKLYENSKKFCVKEFAKLGVKIYTPTSKEKEALATAFGHTNPAWEAVKKNLLGKDALKIFDELYKVARG